MNHVTITIDPATTSAEPEEVMEAVFDCGWSRWTARQNNSVFTVTILSPAIAAGVEAEIMENGYDTKGWAFSNGGVL